MRLSEVIQEEKHPLSDPKYQRKCRTILETKGVLTLPNFLTPPALTQITHESLLQQPNAYYCQSQHTVYLTKSPDPQYDVSHHSDIQQHPRHRAVTSSKGCICDDQIGNHSALRCLYDHPIFREFVMAVVRKDSEESPPSSSSSSSSQQQQQKQSSQHLYSYSDSLSSINVHFYNRGEELGWHFDNSEFAITLLLQKASKGGQFEYVRNLRHAPTSSTSTLTSIGGNTKEMEYQNVTKLLNGEITPEVLDMEEGTLVLFRGRHSIHRVSPNESDRLRILAVLAYNSEPNIALSESARHTFYGRLT